jgi:hypothetical protein
VEGYRYNCPCNIVKNKSTYSLLSFFEDFEGWEALGILPLAPSILRKEKCKIIRSETTDQSKCPRKDQSKFLRKRDSYTVCANKIHHQKL